MICLHPECTGVHDNNRWAERSRRSVEGKRTGDRRYSLRHPDKIYEKNQRDAARRRVQALGEIGIDVTDVELVGSCPAREEVIPLSLRPLCADAHES